MQLANIRGAVTSPFQEYLQDPELAHIVTKQLDLELNFEEWAFIDYMIGLHSAEVMGHKKSSFSTMLNSRKGTANYYAV